MEKGRLCYVFDVFPRYSEQFILRELEALAKEGYAIQVLSTQLDASDWGKRYLEGRGYQLVVFPGMWKVGALAGHGRLLVRRPRLYFKLWKRLWGGGGSFGKGFKRLTEALYFCRHGASGHVHGTFASKPAEIAAWIHQIRGRGFSFSAHARDLYVESEDLERLVEEVVFVHTCTAQNLAYLKGRFPDLAHKFHLIHHGVEEAQAGELALAPVGLRLLAVGRLVPKKGFDLLLEALHQVGDQLGSYECVIVGEGPEREMLAARVRALGLEGRVKLVGALDPERVQAYYPQADLFVMPSRLMEDGDRDGLPNVLLEAGWHGVALLASEVSAIPELVVHGETGWLVPAERAELLGEAIVALYHDAGLRERLGQNVKDKVRGHFVTAQKVGAWEVLFSMQKGGCGG